MLILSLSSVVACTTQGSNLEVGTESPKSYSEVKNNAETQASITTTTFVSSIDFRIQQAMDSECLLPCWWGINLGDSPEEAKKVFELINDTKWEEPSGNRGGYTDYGHFNHIYSREGQDTNLILSVDLLTDDNEVQVIESFLYRSKVDSDNYEQEASFLTRDWERYSLRNIFLQYGKPNLISFEEFNIAEGSRGLRLNLYYLDSGFIISYTPDQDNILSSKKLCLAISDMLSIQFILFDPSTILKDSYKKFSLAKFQLLESPFNSSLQLDSGKIEYSEDFFSKLTLMTLDDFYTEALEPSSDEICLELIIE